MEQADVQALYGGSYAAGYEQTWQHHGAWQAEARLYVQSLGEQIQDGTRWLDVGCGTGWFLGQFPGVARAGVDLSPDMLRQAKVNNPDALFFRQGDIRDDVPEWHDAWDLVSSTGQAWGYVDTIDEVEQVARNMARWTAPNGMLFVQPPDIADLTGCQIPYNFTGEAYPNDTAAITGIVWTYHDEGGIHANQVYPSLDVWVRWLAQWFRRVEVATWPHDPPSLRVPRKLVLASQKRLDGDTTPAEIVVHPAPRALQDDSVGSEPVADPSASNGQVIAGDEASAGYDTLGVVHEQVWAIRAEVADLSRKVSPPVSAPGERLPNRSLYHQPLSYLVGRIRPWSPSFWRSVLRRTGRGGRTPGA